MAHIIDDPAEFGPFSALLPVPADVPTGWLCPFCKRVYGPQVRQCVICSPPPRSFTGPPPRPKAEICCACASPEVVGHNYRGQPFCGPCAGREKPRGFHPGAMSGDSPSWEMLADSLRRERDTLSAEVERLRSVLRDAAVAKPIAAEPARTDGDVTPDP